ncbi:MAG: hypothetical protein WD850_00295 [Candidatus Spechtbacterales bacterium]
MGKFKQAGKMLWWKAKGMSQEDMMKKMAEDPDVQTMMMKVQKGLMTGKITQQELMLLQQKATQNPKEAQQLFEDLLEKVDE